MLVLSFNDNWQRLLSLKETNQSFESTQISDPSYRRRTKEYEFLLFKDKKPIKTSRSSICVRYRAEKEDTSVIHPNAFRSTFNSSVFKSRQSIVWSSLQDKRNIHPRGAVDWERRQVSWLRSIYIFMVSCSITFPLWLVWESRGLEKKKWMRLYIKILLEIDTSRLLNFVKRACDA